MEFVIYDALRDFVPFVQFRKRERYPWRSVFTFLNYKCNQIAKSVTYFLLFLWMWRRPRVFFCILHFSFPTSLTWLILKQISLCMGQWPKCKSAGLPIQGFYVQNHQGLKVHAAFHPSGVDQLSSTNSCWLIG